MLFPLILLPPLVLAAPGLLPPPTSPLKPLFSLLGNIGNADPPTLLYTKNPSLQCAKLQGGNGGELQCCRVAVAGDLPIVVFLAEVYGYTLNKNDVNGVICDDELDTCPGVRMCCEVTALNPLLSLYCADYNPS